MDYTFLPPGLLRRMMYSINISQRNSTNIYRRTNRRNALTTTTLTTTILPPEPTVKAPVISKNLLDKTVISKSIVETECTICHCNIIHSDIIRTIKCKHFYHINCVDYWLAITNTCPQCRFII